MAKNVKGIIWINQGTKKTRTKMYLFDIFSNREEAVLIAQLYKKKDKSKYFILEYEAGTFIPIPMYALYLNNIMTKASLT